MIRANDKGLASTPAVVEEPPRRGLVNSRNVIILVGIVAWIAVLLLFVVPNLTRRNTPEAAAQASVPAAAVSTTAAAPVPGQIGVGAAPKAVPAPQLEVDGRVFNLAGTAAGYKYVKLSVIVQFSDPKGDFAKAKGESLKKLEDDFTASHGGALAAFNDVLTSTVSSKTAADLATAQGKETLRQELITKFNAALGGGEDRVSYVLFSDFVMQ